MRYLSLFSGIEAATVAWHPLGWTCVGVSEIDPFPCAVLRHHYPDVPNLGSVVDITDEQIANLGPIDIVVGGSPCQDLSVAGKRAGLAGARSGLFHHQIRIFYAARHLCGARFLLWENVPGAFSSNRGRDFAAVVGAMAGCSLPVPADGWGTEGVAVGESGLVEWCVLDAQWFGVAQRRRRVFAVLDAGDWSSRPPILLERDSVRGDSPPSREAGKVAPTIPARRTGGGGIGTDFDLDGGLIASTGDVSHCLNAGGMGRQDYETETMVAHTPRGDGFDAGEDGTGRGTPLVPAIAPTLRAGGNKTGGDRPPGTDVDTCESLIPVACQSNAGSHGGDVYHDMSPTLRVQKSVGGGMPAVAYMADDYRDGTFEQADTAMPLTTSADRTRAAPIAAHAMRVRRLTPVECSRLQGFHDDYLDITYRGKPAADGNKYKALGNSMAVPVMRWIGEQIEEALK